MHQFQFPKSEILFTPEGKLVSNALFSSLAGVAQQVLEIDDLHISGADDSVIFQKVLSTDTELRAISNLAPRDWWSYVCANGTDFPLRTGTLLTISKACLRGSCWRTTFYSTGINISRYARVSNSWVQPLSHPRDYHLMCLRRTTFPCLCIKHLLTGPALRI